jgi:hypothetical protein
MNETTLHAAQLVFLLALGAFVWLKWLQKRKAKFHDRMNAAQIFAGLSAGLVALNLEPASSIFAGALSAVFAGFVAVAFTLLAGVLFNHLFTADCPDVEKNQEPEKYKMAASAAVAGGCWLFLIVKMFRH